MFAHKKIALYRLCVLIGIMLQYRQQQNNTNEKEIKRMKETKNNDIRQEIANAELYLWQVAEVIGVNDSNFSRMLRRELPEEKKNRIRKAIKELKRGE